MLLHWGLGFNISVLGLGGGHINVQIIAALFPENLLFPLSPPLASAKFHPTRILNSIRFLAVTFSRARCDVWPLINGSLIKFINGKV